MDFGRNLLVSYENPEKLDDWVTTDVTIEGTTGQKYFALQAGSSMRQHVPSEKVQYTPKVYKITVTADVPPGTSFFKQFTSAELSIIREDGTYTNCTAILSPEIKSVSDKYTFTCYIDVTPSPSIVSLSLLIRATGKVNIYNVSLQPSIDIDPSIQDSIQNSLPNLIYFSNKFSLSIGGGRTNLAFVKIAMGSSANLLLNLFMQGTVSIQDNTKPAYIHFNILLNNAPRTFSPIIVPVSSDRFVFGSPLPLMQVPTGANSVAIEASAVNCRAKIPIENLQLTITGRNIEGGVSSEPPHAEIRDELTTKDLELDNVTIDISIGEIEQTPPIKVQIQDTIYQNDITASYYTDKLQETMQAAIVKEGYIVPIDKDNLLVPDNVDIKYGHTYITYNKQGTLSVEQELGGTVVKGTISTSNSKSLEEVEWW